MSRAGASVAVDMMDKRTRGLLKGPLLYRHCSGQLVSPKELC